MNRFSDLFRALGAVAETNPESLPANTNPSQKFRYLDLSAASNGKIDWAAVSEVQYSIAPSRARRVVRAGDVLFGTVRPALQSHGYVDANHWQHLVASTGFSVVRAKEGKSHPRYLFHSLLSQQVRAQAERDAVGSNYPAVNDGDVRKFRIFAPRVEEQAKVADVLDTLDTAIRQTEAIIEKLKQVKQGLLHDLLTRGIDANGELRPPQSEAPHLYKQSPLGWIPKKWDAKELSGFSAAEITYGIVQAGPHIDGGVPYIRTGDMSGDVLSRKALLCASRRIAESYKRSEVRTGDIVMAIRATVGKVLPVPPDLDGANLTQGTARIAPNVRTDSDFLLWSLRSERAKIAIKSEIKGTTFAEITLEALRKVLIAAPTSKAEQGEIGARLEKLFDRIQRESALRDKFSSEKQGLMDDLLTGRVPVTPLLKQ